MTSPLIHDHNEELVVESYTQEDDAAFKAYMDLQDELGEENFIQFDDDITKSLKDINK